jgi:electron transfer flavoprotein beta subunit
LKIVVCIKQTFDTEAKIVLTANGVNNAGVNLIMNPNDEYAVEEALKLKEKFGGEVTIVSLGGGQVQDTIRQALAMGADKAVLLSDAAFDGGDESVTVAALAKVISGLEYDLVLSGWVAIDDGSAQVPGRLAEALGLPQVNNVTKMETDGSKVTVNREVEGATEVIEVALPALITAQKGLNEPRYPSLKGIMQAKKKEVKKLSAADVGGAAAAKVKIVEYSLPEQRKAGKKLEGEPPETASQLVSLLRVEAKVI